jgi:hypothetical protein
MKPNTAQLLRQGLLTLLVVSAALTAYDRLVLRPVAAHRRGRRG